MKIKINFNKILFWYTLVYIVLNLILGLSFGAWKNNSIALLAFTLILVYFTLKKFPQKIFIKIVSSLLNIFCYAFVTIIWLMNLLTAKTSTQFILGITYTPLVFFFGIELTNKIKILISKLSNLIPVKTINTPDNKSEPISPVKISDKDRRQFLKMIGSTSLGLITLSLMNPKKAGATFFGSVPGPGTISVKDASGNKIDPAAKQPTDGYRITEVDDDTSPSYYGYVDQIGQWYIMKEDSDGGYRYVRGTSNFVTNWVDRADLTYDYFDSIF